MRLRQAPFQLGLEPGPRCSVPVDENDVRGIAGDGVVDDLVARGMAAEIEALDIAFDFRLVGGVGRNGDAPSFPRCEDAPGEAVLVGVTDEDE